MKKVLLGLLVLTGVSCAVTSKNEVARDPQQVTVDVGSKEVVTDCSIYINHQYVPRQQVLDDIARSKGFTPVGQRYYDLSDEKWIDPPQARYVLDLDYNQGEAEKMPIANVLDTALAVATLSFYDALKSDAGSEHAGNKWKYKINGYLSISANNEEYSKRKILSNSQSPTYTVKSGTLNDTKRYWNKFEKAMFEASKNLKSCAELQK